MRQLASAYRIFPAEWNGRQVVAMPHSNDRRGLISKVREGIRLDVERIYLDTTAVDRANALILDSLQ